MKMCWKSRLCSHIFGNEEMITDSEVSGDLSNLSGITGVIDTGEKCKSAEPCMSVSNALLPVIIHSDQVAPIL